MPAATSLPVSGVLLSLSAEKDGFVSSAMPMAVIDQDDQLKIAVTVSEALVPKLSIGDSVDVTVSSVGASFTGTIRAVDKTANAQTNCAVVAGGRRPSPRWMVCSLVCLPT